MNLVHLLWDVTKFLDVGRLYVRSGGFVRTIRRTWTNSAFLEKFGVLAFGVSGTHLCLHSKVPKKLILILRISCIESEDFYTALFASEISYRSLRDKYLHTSLADYNNQVK